jgi:hypothetical protein
VKTICIRFLNKSLLFSILILFMIIGLVVSYSYGGEKEEKKITWGFSVLGGIGDTFYSQPQTRVYGFLPRISLPLHKNWDLEFEGNFFYYDIHKMHDFYFLGVSHNFLFKPIQERFGSLFFLIGGGLGYDSAGKRLGKRLYPGNSRVPLIGDKHFAGVCHAGAGMLFNIGRSTALRVEYRLYHISEPFDRADYGLNTHAVLLGLTFK